jgi:hypothetical protein
MDVIQIVPRLPPAIDGLGDYAFYLAKQLRNDWEIDSRFVVGNPQWKSEQEIGFPVLTVDERSSASLLEALQSPSRSSISSVLLHYVGYGYARRACPFWLIRGLEQWKRECPGRRLITVFHEIYAFGPPWASSFWTSPFQRLLARRLAVISDQIVTPTRMYARILEKFCHSFPNRVISMPVFSNVGEPAGVRPQHERKNQIIVFGNVYQRSQVYGHHLEALIYTCRTLKLDRIVDVGPTLEVKSKFPLPFTQLGKQSAVDVSALLLSSRVGFLTYFDGYLAKSGIFAAYCAHGMLPVLPCRNASEPDGIRAEHEYTATSDMFDGVSDTRAQKIADGAHAWYQEHSIPRTAATLAGVLKNLGTATNGKASLD